jgi:2-polyprenyl-6-methoxyphenol hydroxylase-like FAD-dependent oxidoreductase
VTIDDLAILPSAMSSAVDEAGGHETVKTTCCVVGGGPGGMMLSLLLARAGVSVTLLEAHKDFDRDFRGDTIHPSVLEVLGQIGLAGRLHELPHSKMRDVRFTYPTGVYTMAALSRLPTQFPYVMMMPQARFLEFLAAEAQQYPHFRLIMGANVQQLLDEDGAIRGVRYRTAGGWGEVRSLFTVGADGRFSRIRKLAALEPVSQSPRMDVLWLRLPRERDDQQDGTTIHVGCGYYIAVLTRMHEWQVGCIIPTGSCQQLKAKGVGELQRSLAAAVPWLAGSVESLSDWRQINVLSIEANRLSRWYRPGLLLIGDAAHAMLPVGGVGINCAIGDAVEAVNVLAGPLRDGCVRDNQLATVQRRRAGITRMIQYIQTGVQKRMVNRALTATKPFGPPIAARIMPRVPGLRDWPTQLMMLGIPRVRLAQP